MPVASKFLLVVFFEMHFRMNTSGKNDVKISLRSFSS